jgi:hypothetical protein
MGDPVVDELRTQTKVLEKLLNKADQIETYLDESRAKEKNREDNFLESYFEKIALGSVIVNISKIVQLLKKDKKQMVTSFYLNCVLIFSHI